MPNHCEQDLFIYGEENVLREFVEFSKDSIHGEPVVLSANKYIPYPQKYIDMDRAAEEARAKGNYDVKDGFNSGGYEWCCNNWGSKWGIYNAIQNGEKFAGKRSRLNYSFNSAWSPVTPVIHAMSIKFPTIRFKLKYYERGMRFKGTFEVEAAEVIQEIEMPYRGNRGG